MTSILFAGAGFEPTIYRYEPIALTRLRYPALLFNIPSEGLKPPHLAALEPKSSASTNSAKKVLNYFSFL